MHRPLEDPTASDRRVAERRLGWLAVLGGGLLALAVQIAGPVGVPLYDGVVVTEPYRFLHPTGDQVGFPSSFSETTDIQGVMPEVVAATSEQPPQAQLVALGAAFSLTIGATAIKVSIEPIEAPAPPAGAAIAGNVYRFAVTDQAGNPLPAKACEGCRTILLRAPDGTGDATIQRYENAAWVKVETDHAGSAGLYQTNVTVLGDYAVITGGASPSASGGGPGGQAPGADPLVILGGGALAIWLVILVVVVWTRTRTRPAPVRGPGPSGRPRIPSKRKPPRKQPPGRST